MNGSATVENPNRRRYHLAVGATICFTVYTVIVVAVRAMLG